MLAQQTTPEPPKHASPAAGGRSRAPAQPGVSGATARPAQAADDALGGLLAAAVSRRRSRNPARRGAGAEDGERKTRSCVRKTGPTYNPNGGVVPITTTATHKVAAWSWGASFEQAPSWWQIWREDSAPSCCEVRQYIKWDRTFHDDAGGPPHTGFPATCTHGVWYEDRDDADNRYGRRSGPHSDPQPGMDEYLTGGVRDQANGDTYVGTDSPQGLLTDVGQWQFQTKIVDTCNAGAVKASSAIITINW